ncbi:hypothetical protein Misp04_08860 [Micromonospora sp. NBRC 101691]|nr:hypothetical protein Misp04_08860 [Micromonospora sp. NBRC 101691]
MPNRVTLVAPMAALALTALPATGPAAHPVGWASAPVKPVPLSASDPARPTAGPVFRWPLDAPSPPVRDFDPPPRPWLPGHRGVDLAAPADARVRSAGAGVVLFAGMVAGRPVVTVGHAEGLRTTYEPVRPSVRVGARVAAGTPLGELSPGHAGCPAPACLHWGLRRGEEYLDPLALLGPVPVRLLPSPVRPTGRAAGRPAGRTGRAAGRPAGRTGRAAGRTGRAAGRTGQRWASRGGRRTARRSYSSALL